MSRRFPWIVLAIGCACTRPPEHPQALATPPSRPVASVDTGLEPRDERFEAKLAERDRLHDWRSTIFGTRAPNAPSTKRAKVIPKSGVFARSRIATVRAYAFVDDFHAAPPADAVLARGVPFVSDGRLNDRVIPSEVVLTKAEADSVLRLLEQAEATFDDPADVPAPRARREGAKRKLGHRPRMRCGFDPHHVFVFFDDADVPIAKLFVCFECGELVAEPRSNALAGESPGGMTPDETATFRAIFDAHGLGAWTYGESEEAREVTAYEERVYGTPQEPTPLGLERRAARNARPSGAPANLTPKLATPAEREHLCVWLHHEMDERNRQLAYGVKGAFECEGGTSYQFSSEAANGCDDPARLCDVPMGRIEACLQSSVLRGAQALCASGPTAECEGLMACLPWVDWKSATHR